MHLHGVDRAPIVRVDAGPKVTAAARGVDGLVSAAMTNGTGPLGHVVVVGASLAGLRACETLRTDGFTGRITLVGAEREMPYDRPPLSKKLLSGEWEPDRIVLRKPDDVAGLGLETMLGVRASGLDTERRTEGQTQNNGDDAGHDANPFRLCDSNEASRKAATA